MMKRITTQILVAALTAAWTAGAAAAEVTVFKQPHFSGEKLALHRDTNDLSSAGFQDQISSLVVHSGRWQFCSQPDFNGDCVVLGPGRYPQLAENMNHRIESAREVSRYAANDRYREGRYADNGRYGESGRHEDHGRYGERHDWRGGRYAERGAVELFPGPDFHGRGLALDRDVDALDEMPGGVSSLVVHEGRWQACTRPGFAGRCSVFDPGRYADLGRLDNRIASMRRIG